MVFRIKRRRSPEKMMSHSQPVPHVQTKENYKIQYKKQKALVLKDLRKLIVQFNFYENKQKYFKTL